MVPYRGRMALRVARVFLAFATLGAYPFLEGSHISASLAFLVAYAIFAAGTLYETRFDVQPRALISLAIDGAFFAYCLWLLPVTWAPALAFGYLLASAAMLHPYPRVIGVGAAAILFIILRSGPGPLLWVSIAAAILAASLALHKDSLDRRMSRILRYNVIVRSEAEGAREAERERVAADFHDGPLQNFIAFQMRLEVIKKLLGRDVAQATEELRQLQELCKTQVTELRGFVRSMRPVDEGASLGSSLSRMVEQFQRDTGIAATFSTGEIHDPSQTEVSLELLQIVRETLNNIHKHSGASRVAVFIGQKGQKLEVKAEDNGGGFPFSGSYTLEELELMRMGPVSIKRRVRMLGGDLLLESRPGQGASLEIRVPLS
jgi:signal transduction histidine kinase